jgi:putative nucleotidyltransferase with HDIG domain
MPENLQKTTTASKQVELAVGRLDSLSILPCVAAQLLPKLLQSQFHPSALNEIIESDPVLTSLILSHIGRYGISLPDGRFSISKALDQIPAHEVRNTLLSIEVTQAFDQDNDIGDKIISHQKGLFLHSIAVACCAKNIAETASPQMDPQLAYNAGLLHDIGKLAIEKIMPKSYSQILEQAESSGQNTHTLEQKHLGTDHTIIGKRLAQKWRFPNLIMIAIWLHHNQTAIICRDIPEARIAAVVQLADSIARQSEIGWSGSFDSPEPIEPLARELSITIEKLQNISQQLPDIVEQKSKVLGLELPGSREKYGKTLHEAVVQFARRDTELSQENRRLQSASSHLEFIKEFLLSIDSAATAVDLAENLAARWQRFYQTGRVCLFLAPPAGSQIVEAVTVENLAQSEVISLNAPAETSVIPEFLSNGFAIVNAHDYLDWLFEQLDFNFDENRTKLLPLLYGGRAVGAIAFELHYPSETELFEKSFMTSASIAGAVLGTVVSLGTEQRYSERFGRLITAPTKQEPAAVPTEIKKEPRQLTQTEVSMDALAEMAAGAAHELNNPLAVISGRAQLLSEAENNQEKKQILEQIHENANEASEIIEDLMSFAEPPQPRPAQIRITQIIDEAIQLAGRKANIEELDIQIEVPDDIESVYVDSAQIVSAIANIITNAVESYGDDTDSILIAAVTETETDMIKLSIKDHGCGMDEKTLQKAVQPFFSARPAGRKRGMGLAYAARLIDLNNGFLNIESEPDVGTTVSISLPRK